MLAVPANAVSAQGFLIQKSELPGTVNGIGWLDADLAGGRQGIERINAHFGSQGNRDPCAVRRKSIRAVSSGQQQVGGVFPGLCFPEQHLTPAPYGKGSSIR